MSSQGERIHRPTYFNASSSSPESFILSGGESSRAVSMFRIGGVRGGASNEDEPRPVFSRGKLPVDVGDVWKMDSDLRQLAVSFDNF